MNQDKAYKLLALQENISNNEAKALIDTGIVSARGKKVEIARALMSVNTKFQLQKIQKATKIFENDEILAVNKPAFLTSQSVADEFKFELLNRLDKETSGVLLLAKTPEFRTKAIAEYKAMRVKKEYIAVVNGIISDEMEINEPILTLKSKSGAISKISKNGKEAITRVRPLMISGKKTLILAEILTGRTHQIRVHLASLGHFIIGERKYAKSNAKRLFLHSYKTEILGLKFRAEIPREFGEFGFEISKNTDF